MTSIIKGDGSWQNLLDAGRCPKCGGEIEHQLAPNYKKQCSVCKLTIIDTSTPSDKIKDDTMPSEWESDMYETRLEPTEDQIFADAIVKKNISWSDAVTIIDQLVLEKMEYMNDYPETYTAQDYERLELAWNRILRG